MGSLERTESVGDEAGLGAIDGEESVEAWAEAALGRGEELGETLGKLAAKSKALDRSLRKQISSHHHNLLTQAMGIESLEEILDSLNAHVGSLSAVAKRSATKTTELYSRTEQRTLQLQRLHETCNLLRAVIRVLSLVGKLQVGGEPVGQGGRELVRRASQLAELAELTAETDLRGISAVEKELVMIPRLRKELLDQANATLRSALPSQNQSLVSGAVTALWHLGEIKPALDAFLGEHHKELGRRIQSLGQRERRLEPSGGRPGGASLPNSATIRAHIWEDVVGLSGALESAQAQMLTLAAVLQRKPELLRPEEPAEESQEEDVAARFWKTAAAVLAAELGGRTGLVKQTLESEFPKLLRQLADLLARLAEGGGERAEAAKEMRTALSGLETAYLSKSLGHMFETLNMAFGEDAAPSEEELRRVGAVLGNELQAAAFDAALCRGVAGNVAKSLQLFGVKSEALIDTNSGDASQVISPPNGVQRRNVEAMNAVRTFSAILAAQTDRVRCSLASPELLEDVAKAGRGLEEIVANGLQPLLDSVLDSVSAILDTMHQEDFGEAAGSEGGGQCSLYMRELQEFLSRVASQHLAHVADRDEVYRQGALVAGKAVRMFLRQATLVRPLGEGGRLRLAADFAQMELAVEPLCRRLAVDLGKDYASLRAVRPLLFASPEEIVASPMLGGDLDYWLAVHLLIQASPPALASPHASAGWSIARYSDWLEAHPSQAATQGIIKAERLQFLRGTVDAYAQRVASDGAAEYAPTYPLLTQLFQRAAKELA